MKHLTVSSSKPLQEKERVEWKSQIEMAHFLKVALPSLQIHSVYHPVYHFLNVSTVCATAQFPSL